MQARIWHQRTALFRRAAWFFDVFPLRLPLCLAVTCCPVLALGEEGPRFELNWQAPQQCPDGIAVNREVLDLVASTAGDTSKLVIVANGSITADRAGFTLVLTVRDAEGNHERRLEAPACDELSHAAALIVALAINPALLATHSDPAGLSQTGNVPRPRSAERSPATHDERPHSEQPRGQVPAATPLFALPTTKNDKIVPIASTPEPLAWRLGLGAFVAFRTLPGTNLGTALRGALQWRALRVETTASQLHAEASTHSPRVGAAFALYRAAAKVCWLAMQGKAEFGPCTGAEIGLVHGRGYGVDTSTVQNGLWVAATVGALFEWRVATSSFLGITVDAELPSGDRFELANATIFEPRISARVGANLSAGW